MKQKVWFDAQVEGALNRILATLRGYYQMGQAEKAAALQQRLREIAGADEAEKEQMDALRREAEAGKQLAKWYSARYLESAGAADGEYLVGMLADEFPVCGDRRVMEEMLRAAKERYPALFIRKLCGVKPMKSVYGGEMEMGLAERMRMANEDPEGYRMLFR